MASLKVYGFGSDINTLPLSSTMKDQERNTSYLLSFPFLLYSGVKQTISVSRELNILLHIIIYIHINS